MTIVIDSVPYDIPIISMKRKAEFLSKYAERSEDGVLHTELVGVYFNYSISFGQITDTTVYAALWTKLTEAVEFHDVVVYDQDGEYTFTAYFSSVGDELRKVKDAVTFWKSLTVNFIAQSPAVTPA